MGFQVESWPRRGLHVLNLLCHWNLFGDLYPLFWYFSCYRTLELGWIQEFEQSASACRSDPGMQR